jgi:hypothetical protein
VRQPSFEAAITRGHLHLLVLLLCINCSKNITPLSASDIFCRTYQATAHINTCSQQCADEVSSLCQLNYTAIVTVINKHKRITSVLACRLKPRKGLTGYHELTQTGNNSRRIRLVGFVLRARKLGNMYTLASSQNLKSSLEI